MSAANPSRLVPKLVRVLSTKFEGSPHYDYLAELVPSEDDTQLVLLVRGGTLMQSYRGPRDAQATFTQVFWPSQDVWWNAEHYHEPLAFPDQASLLTYVNVALPATFDGETVRWVDLDLDVILTESGPVLLDEDEFAEHLLAMRYPDDLITRARDTAASLLEHAAHERTPFDRATHIVP